MRAPDLALITGAGWKGGFIEALLPPGSLPHRCPEILYPLCNETVVERVIKQLRRIGTKLFMVGLANPGALLTREAEDYWKEVRGHTCPPPRGAKYMTPERVAQVRRYGAECVLVNDALRMSEWSTLAALLKNALAVKGWETAVKLAGDYVWDTGFLSSILEEAEYPSLCWLMRTHDIFFFDRESAAAWLKFHNEALVTGGEYYSPKTPKKRLGPNAMWHLKDKLGALGFNQWRVEERFGLDRKTFDPVLVAELGIRRFEYDAACRISVTDPVTK